MNIFVHACCGVCALYPIKILKEEGHQLKLYYSNPNIHPYKEWKERKKTFVEVAESYHVPYLVDKEYPLEAYLGESLAAENRCIHCYTTRLNNTAKVGKELGFEAFTTTLTLSIYQNHDLIRKIGEEAGEKHGIPFIYRDFRDGFQWAQEKAKADGLYRQKYCGCIFSERDRYKKK